MYVTDEMRAHHITCIDTEKGISLQTGKESDDLKIILSDSHIYGEHEALDCPAGHDCYCREKFGFMFMSNNVKPKDLHIVSKSARPIYKIKSFGAYGGEAFIDRVEFHNFNTGGVTKCQNKQHIF